MKALYLAGATTAAVAAFLLFGKDTLINITPASVSTTPMDVEARAEPKGHVTKTHKSAFEGMVETPSSYNTTASAADSIARDAAGDPIEDTAPYVPEALEERYRTLSKNADYPTLSSRLDALNSRRPDSDYSAEDVLAAMSHSEAWETQHEPGDGLKLTEEERTDGRAFVNYNPLKVESLMPGDTMPITIDQLGQTLDMRVDRVRIYDDGNIMWKGTILGEEGGAVSITQSDRVTIASVTLAQEDFILEAHGNEGWIVNGGALFKINPETTDIVHEGH